MSDLRMNSIAAAVIGTVLGVMGVGVAVDSIIHPSYPEKPGFAPDVVIAPEGGGAPVAELPPDFGTLFADAAGLEALVTRGEALVSACRSCHTFEAGGPNGTGPNLHDLFGRQAASHAGFAYSDAMRAHAVRWDYDTLNTFLESPATTVRGTQMVFAGLRRTNDRVAVIAYLRSISPNNVPLPPPSPPPAETAEAPAEGAAAPAETPAPPPG